VLKITDGGGKVLAYNDDFDDPEAGTNTHSADSYLSLKLPADGTYYVHLGDTARAGGEEYAYRLRISHPQPDFSLFCVPSSVSVASKGSGMVNVQVVRKEGFTGLIKVTLKDPPAGFIGAASYVVRHTDDNTLLNENQLDGKFHPMNLAIEGRAKIGEREIAHLAIPAEDRMQAFLWRHLVPAQGLELLVSSPPYQPPFKRPQPSPAPPPPAAPKPAATDAAAAKLKFTPQQVAGRLRQLKVLLDEEYLTKGFTTARLRSAMRRCERLSFSSGKLPPQ